MDAITLIVLIISLTVARHYSTRSLLFPSVARNQNGKIFDGKKFEFYIWFLTDLLCNRQVLALLCVVDAQGSEEVDSVTTVTPDYAGLRLLGLRPPSQNTAGPTFNEATAPLPTLSPLKIIPSPDLGFCNPTAPPPCVDAKFGFCLGDEEYPEEDIKVRINLNIFNLSIIYELRIVIFRWPWNYLMWPADLVTKQPRTTAEFASWKTSKTQKVDVYRKVCCWNRFGPATTTATGGWLSKTPATLSNGSRSLRASQSTPIATIRHYSLPFNATQLAAFNNIWHDVSYPSILAIQSVASLSTLSKCLRLAAVACPARLVNSNIIMQMINSTLVYLRIT